MKHFGILNYRRRIRNCYYLSNACLILAAASTQAAVEVTRYDFTKPTSTLRSLGLAIKNDDPKTFAQLIYSENRAAVDEFVKEAWGKPTDVWGLKTGGAIRVFLMSPRLGTAPRERVVQYFLDSEVIQEKSILDQKVGNELAYLTVRVPHEKIIRKETFIRKIGGEMWQWVFEGSKEEALYDRQTPLHAYRAVGQTLRYHLLDELCSSLATSVCGGLSVKECERLLRERLANMPESQRHHIWEDPYFETARENLEEEMLAVDQLSSWKRCKVWNLGGIPKQRHDGELFIQEGDEWKWLPRPDSFWYPTKIEKQEKAP